MAVKVRLRGCSLVTSCCALGKPVMRPFPKTMTLLCPCAGAVPGRAADDDGRPEKHPQVGRLPTEN